MPLYKIFHFIPQKKQKGRNRVFDEKLSKEVVEK